MQINTIIFTQIVQNNVEVKITIANMQMTINTRHVTPTEQLFQYCDKATDQNKEHMLFIVSCCSIVPLCFPSHQEGKNVYNFTPVRVNNPHLSKVVNLTPKRRPRRSRGIPGTLFSKHLHSIFPLVPRAAVHAPSCTAPRCAAAR